MIIDTPKMIHIIAELYSNLKDLYFITIIEYNFFDPCIKKKKAKCLFHMKSLFICFRKETSKDPV